MKNILILGAIGLTAILIWLSVNQVRVQKKLTNLQAENQKLAETLSEVTTKKSADELPARFDQTQLALNRAEERLSNITTQIAAAKREMQNMVQAANAITTALPTRSDPVPPSRPPASSHSADGQLLKRNWGPEQALGPPDTKDAGDIVTAWASRSPDAGEEWLKLDYDGAVDLAEIRVRETFNPGAISKVTAFLPNGEEITIWEGVEPIGEAPVDTAFPVNTPIRPNSIKVYLDTRRVAGWNEIDAVELIGRDGTQHWASSATTSSTYAEP